ncbi:hypothetical protein BS78_K230100 [Paspalum vaginatum]|uniref:Cysteine proteinase inhibitor n=1 Tax=Paspalum vaginatum TaxID=158149 RepID=A0A9W7XBP2_9POAL|nr:hypothetical protein BS78_K230100 [Paspalum vaginatum]
MWSSSPVLVIFLVLVPLALAARPSTTAIGAPSQLGDAATTSELREHEHVGRDAPAPVDGDDAFYHKVGKFAVWVYSMWHEIKPVPELEEVLSASTRPAEGGAVDYVLVLRVARLGTCRALVWGVPSEGSQDWKLKYFEPAVGA